MDNIDRINETSCSLALYIDTVVTSFNCITYLC